MTVPSTVSPFGRVKETVIPISNRCSFMFSRDEVGDNATGYEAEEHENFFFVGHFPILVKVRLSVRFLYHFGVILLT